MIVSVANTTEGRRGGDSRSRAPDPTNVPGPRGRGARGKAAEWSRQPVGRRGAAAAAAPEKAAGLLPPAVPPLWPCSLGKGGSGGGVPKGGELMGGNSLAGAARRVERERSDRAGARSAHR